MQRQTSLLEIGGELMDAVEHFSVENDEELTIVEVRIGYGGKDGRNEAKNKKLRAWRTGRNKI